MVDQQDNVRDAIDNALSHWDVLLFADVAAGDALRRHAGTDAMSGTLLAVLDNPGAPVTAAYNLAIQAAQADKPIRTWCTPTDDGRKIARAVARTLDQHLPGNSRVLHVTAPDPREWQPLVTPFYGLVDGASLTLPPAPQSRQPRSSIPPPFDTSPAEVARLIIQRFGAELLVVAPPAHEAEGYSTGYALDDHGVWQSGGDPWARWMVLISNAMRRDAAEAGLENKALSYTLSQINRIKRPGMVDQVRPMLRAMLDLLREDGDPCYDVTECRAEYLDANPRYMGAINGVIDLYTGRLLPPDQGRRHLVTRRVPVPFNPDAQHPAVDRLFSHMQPELRKWWWSVLGRAMRGPTKHLYAAVGVPNGGKTTLLKAIRETLGPYAQKAARGVLSAGNRASETQLTPGLLAWFSPVRFVLIEEERRRQTLDAGLVKDLTGGGILSARGMRENLREERVMATTLMFANTDSVPRLSLETEGMQDRYRELPYPKVPGQLDEALRDQTTADPAFQTAMLARLVSWAARTPSVPNDIPIVREATANRIREDIGELGAFARRVVPGGEILTVAELWTAWCQHNDEPADAKEPGGLSKRKLSGALRDYVDGLPAPKQISVQGHNARGWRNWRLLSIDEAAGADQEAPEVVHADDPETRARHLRSLLGPHRYRLPDGTLLTGTELAAEIIRLEAQPDGVKWSVEMPPGGVQIDSSILRATLEPRRSVAEPSLPLPFDNGAGGLDHFPK